MIHLRKHGTSSIFKWVFDDSHRISSFCYNGNNTRFCSYIVQAARVSDKTSHRLSGEGNAQIANRKEAQAALLDYLHCTRNLLFADAENMSKNSPLFLEKLLEKVGAEEDVGKSVSKYLRYSPINEFEPFFESLGLKPREYHAILPRDLIFLNDDELFMGNYKFLCRCGIERKNIGKFLKEAPEVFRYKNDVLELKFEAYKKLGLTNFFVAKLVECSPYLLLGNVNKDLIEVLQILRKGGIEFSWIEEHLADKTSYNWSRVHAVLEFLLHMGGSNNEMLALISLHPGMLFEDSGSRTLSLVSFLMKFGFNKSEICSVFQGFPKISVATFVSNMMRSFQLMSDVDMRVSDIGKMIRSHALLLGSYKLKQSNSLLKIMNVGKKRLRKLMQANPQELKTLAIGSKVRPLPSVKDQSKLMKTKFLLELGFIDEPYIIEKALKRFRGSGVEIQERFNCLVEAGLDEKEVCEMVKAYPEILNQSSDSIKTKIDFLLNDIGYPLSTLVSCPAYLNYNMQRVKLRIAMFDWLKDHGICNKRCRKLRTVISYSDERFVRWYVKHHPRGLEVWEDLKKRSYSESGGNHKAHYCTGSSVLSET